MQIAAAIALTVLYVGIAVAWGGVHPGAGAPWWIFATFIVMFFATVLAWRMSALLPVPWIGGGRYGRPPRRVHLSWRTAFRIPIAAPVLVIAYHLHGNLSRHFDLGWVLYVVAAIAAIAVAAVARQRWREVGLLRNGQMALGIVDSRCNLGDGPDRLAYRFTTTRGETVSGRGWDVGYGVVAGSRVPVFYDAGHPEEHVIACACWCEAE